MDRSPPYEDALTARELEVAGLVARGLSNKQIGSALVVTTGTARCHVERIRRKLGVGTRTEIAVWWALRAGGHRHVYVCACGEVA